MHRTKPLGARSTVRIVPALVSLVVLVATAGCGGSATSSPAPATGPAATSPAAAPATDVPSSGAPSADAGVGGCPGALATTIKDHVGSSAVSAIQIIGGCTMASIETSLARTDAKAGLDICDKAAEVAYTDDVNSISVESGDGKELAVGIKGAPCIGEP
jgi:hypothetical protein